LQIFKINIYEYILLYISKNINRSGHLVLHGGGKRIFSQENFFCTQKISTDFVVSYIAEPKILLRIHVDRK